MKDSTKNIRSSAHVLWATVTAAFASQAAYAEQWLTSAPMTFRFGVEADWPTPSARVDNDHVDLDFNYTGNGTFDSFVHADSGSLPRDASHLYANASTRYNLASVPAFIAGSLGVQPNEDFWVLQQNQFGGQLYLGIASHNTVESEMLAWNPGDPRGGANANRSWLQVQLVDVRAPKDGAFAMWQSGINFQTLYYSNHVNGIDASDAFYLTPGGHTHFNWGFTKAGLWEIDFQVRTLTSLEWLEGDANHDNAVNFDDLLILAQNYGKPLGGYWDIGDFNGDFAVGFDDLLLLAQNYGAGAPAAFAEAQLLSIQIPEPATMVGAVSLAGLAVRRRRVKPMTNRHALPASGANQLAMKGSTQSRFDENGTNTSVRRAARVSILAGAGGLVRQRR